MKRERRQLTAREWREITTPGLVVRKVPGRGRAESTRPENTTKVERRP